MSNQEELLEIIKEKIGRGYWFSSTDVSIYLNINKNNVRGLLRKLHKWKRIKRYKINETRFMWMLE